MADFPSPTDALAAAEDLLDRLSADGNEPDCLRMAIDTCSASMLRAHRVSRGLAVLHITRPGQVLTTQSAAILPYNATLKRSLHPVGSYRLSDLGPPVPVYELGFAGQVTQHPLPGIDAVPHNLPILTTNFFGRVQELDQLTQILPSTRLVTLTGPGGSGKTRLALQAGAAVADRFADGVWLVRLAGLTEPSLVPEAVAQVLGVRESSDLPLAKSLTAWLSARRLLLILDNCEHLSSACAELTTAWLSVCPKLSLLTTSRNALNVPWELAMRVSPLPFGPSADADGTGSVASQLFIQRAMVAQPSFAPDQKAVAVVERICSHLDGLPLALELAASRLSVLTLTEIDERLKGSFSILSSREADVESRHRTLNQAIDWSYNLLGTGAQKLLRRAAIFGGSFSVDAVETVCSLHDLPKADMISTLDELIGASIITRGEENAQSRYHLPESIKEYGRAQLTDAGENLAVSRTLWQWCGNLVGAEQARAGDDLRSWLECLDIEYPNIRAVLSGPVMAEETGMDSLSIVVGLWRYWLIRGRFEEGRAHLRTMLHRERGHAPTSSRAAALRAAGILAGEQGDYAEADHLLQESLTIFRRVGDSRSVGVLLQTLGTIAARKGDNVRALNYLAEGLTFLKATGDAHSVATCLMMQGTAAGFLGDYSRATAALVEALNNFRSLGNQRGIAACLNNQAQIALAQRSFHDVHEPAYEALLIVSQLGDQPGVASAMDTLATLYSAIHLDHTAVQLHGAVHRIRTVNGIPVHQNDKDALERALETSRSRLGASTYEELFACGQALSITEVLHLAATPIPRYPLPTSNESSVPLDSGGQLSTREVAVTRLLMAGLTNAEIATRLFVSPRTVDAHVRNIFKKIGLGSRAELAVWAVKNHLEGTR